MALDNSLKNIFAVSELRNRVLFTLALLGVYRIGGRIVTPGVDIRALEEFAPAARQEQHVRPVRHVHGQQPREGHDFRAGHHAVHQLVDHSPAADGGVAVPGEAVEGRRAGPPQDHAVHALRDDRAVRRAVARHRVLPRAQHDAERVSPGDERGLGIPADDDPDAVDGDGVRHVARRADYRARHRQRHVAHHLRGHRRQLPARR